MMSKMMKYGVRRSRGFALLVVMLLVALVGLGAAALLDIVNVDIVIAAEHRKAVEADSMAVGAVLESIGSDQFLRQLPAPRDNDSELTRRLMDRVGGGQYEFLGSAFPAERSAFIENVGSNAESGYESEVSLLRIIPRQNTSHNFAVAVYEVRARASVSGGDASSEARSLVYVPVAVRSDEVARQRHAR